ncbi:MAG: molybdopterin-guanine dinucleotide biosynthesis protein B [Clostridia bacterium]|nr:molybdopterin-guanine dinucleotide biosynthesis protein B [Clostridia bacterium]
MKVFTVLGLSSSGKTTTIEKLIVELKSRGYSVGTVKEIHYEAFAIDSEGKNTWRHRKAGAATVTARSMRETDILYEGKLPIYEVLAHYKEDYVILEGVRDAVAPELAVCAEDALPAVSPLTIAITGRYANNHSGEYEGVPVINGVADTARLVDLIEQKVPDLMYDMERECCSLCGSDCREFLAKVLKGEKDILECAIRKPKIALTVGGEKVPMVPFVEKLLRNAVLGVVKELKGYKEGAEITVRLR